MAHAAATMPRRTQPGPAAGHNRDGPTADPPPAINR